MSPHVGTSSALYAPSPLKASRSALATSASISSAEVNIHTRARTRTKSQVKKFESERRKAAKDEQGVWGAHTLRNISPKYSAFVSSVSILPSNTQEVHHAAMNASATQKIRMSQMNA